VAVSPTSAPRWRAIAGSVECCEGGSFLVRAGANEIRIERAPKHLPFRSMGDHCRPQARRIVGRRGVAPTAHCARSRLCAEQPRAYRRLAAGRIVIPISVLTGFLGRGKTTLLSHLLRQPEFSKDLQPLPRMGIFASQAYNSR